MFCRKCGNEIPDDSIFCLKCGTKVEIVETRMKSTENIEERGDVIIETESFEKTEKKDKYGIWFCICAAILILIIALVFSGANKCEFSSCDEEREVGSNYCYYHTCRENGCTSSKSRDNTYCYIHELEHQCTLDWCDNSKCEESEYCSEHKCAKTGCTNRHNWTGDYCDTHTINMRDRLEMKGFHFSLNSAGGIELDFRAENKSGKEIKYIRFDIKMQNAVGDSLTDDISGSYTIPVEIIGPVKSGKEVYVNDGLIGYCDNCARIDVDDITIIYTDETSETGYLGYYADR